MFHVFHKMREIVFHEIKMFRGLYDFHKNNQNMDAKRLLYQYFVRIFHSNGKDLDLFGSESEEFFEPLLKTNLRKMIKIENEKN